jgi:hypothetical protein
MRLNDRIRFYEMRCPPPFSLATPILFGLMFRAPICMDWSSN